MPANLLVSPNDFTVGGAVWGLGGAGGTATPHVLTDTDAAQVYFVGQNITIPANLLNYVFAFEILKTVAATNFPALDVRFGAVLSSVVVNTDLGTLTDRSGWSPTGSGIRDMGTYWQAWLYNTNTNSTVWSVIVEPAFNSNGSGTPSVAATGPATFRNGYFGQGNAPPTGSPSQFFMGNM